MIKNTVKQTVMYHHHHHHHHHFIAREKVQITVPQSKTWHDNQA